MDDLTRRILPERQRKGEYLSFVSEGIKKPDPGSGLSEAKYKGKNDLKIVVAYESEHGSTGEIAFNIEKILRENGHEASTRRISDIHDLDSYHAIIIGSPVRYDRWMPAARKFIQEKSEILAAMPVAYFFTSLALAVESEKSEKNAVKYAEKICSLAPEIKPVSIGMFAGVLDYSRFSFLFRMFLKAVFAMIGLREGDYRDWGAVEEWVMEIHLKLTTKDRKHPVVG
jgi:menaquinone-dependent protoporphyrinogen oxidase